jgi:hypothetical protein
MQLTTQTPGAPGKRVTVTARDSTGTVVKTGSGPLSVTVSYTLTYPTFQGGILLTAIDRRGNGITNTLLTQREARVRQEWLWDLDTLKPLESPLG